MSKAITLRVDENIKEQAEPMFVELGLNMTTYLNMALNAFVRQKGIPFKVSLYSSNEIEYLAKLEHSISQIDNGEVVRYTREQRNEMMSN